MTLRNFLFNIQQPEQTVKDVAESALREVAGESQLQPLLTRSRQETETAGAGVDATGARRL